MKLHLQTRILTFRQQPVYILLCLVFYTCSLAVEFVTDSRLGPFNVKNKNVIICVLYSS